MQIFQVCLVGVTSFACFRGANANLQFSHCCLASRLPCFLDHRRKEQTTKQKYLYVNQMLDSDLTTQLYPCKGVNGQFMKQFV